MKIKYILLFMLAAVLFVSCSHPQSQDIIDKTIARCGGELYKHSKITFLFRGADFSILRNKGKFEYTKTFTDTLGNLIHDKLNNYGFTRTVNGKTIDLSDIKKEAYSNSLNSVVYFASLPYPLNDAAVRPKMLGTTKIGNEEYYKLEITFSQNAGGIDYKDRYIYWINADDYFIDYFAYYYHVNGGGSRFRKLINKRTVNGIFFADNINYKADGILENIEDYETALKNNTLEKVSEIIYEHVEVTIL